MKNRWKKGLIIVFAIVFVLLPASFWGFRFFSKNYIPTNAYPEVSSRLQQHVYRFSHELARRETRHPENLNKAAEYIKNEFEIYGCTVKRQSYNVNEGPVENIIARKNWKYDGEVIVVGAHYDTADNPGADDNASGVATMLELARQLSNINVPIPVEFVAFVNEEPPYYHSDKMGSSIYVETLKNENRSIKTALILEMVGYYKDTWFSQEYPGLFGFFFPNKGNFIALVGNASSSDLTKKIKQEILRSTPLPVERIAFDFTAKFLDFSDQWAFWKKGMSAIMITDTSFFRNPNYHKQTDTHDTLDYGRMSELTIGLKNFLMSFKEEN